MAAEESQPSGLLVFDGGKQKRGMGFMCSNHRRKKRNEEKSWTGEAVCIWATLLEQAVHYSVQTGTGPKTGLDRIGPDRTALIRSGLRSLVKPFSVFVELEYPDHQTPEKDSKTKDFTLILEPPMPLPLNRSHSQASRQKVTPTPDTRIGTGGLVEKRLPNGDLYIGTFLGNFPHGLGKYLWPDGYMYEGEWKKGKANGKGKFSWPYGAYL
ncbi:hypothetical protein Cgig2_009496 [Carnegiea gigantea]|uniref:MORN repeat-containing protein n=1 Tax=Carnegiea gigantea TaxID=171969 RepID=A0A9Q1GPP1_9CARY|nr:hypothetical protein Cgig2_009496 [Carnegiea gigantea]